ncbi:Protein FAF-like [Actinidia chinensis var. chinensis]|uniref:Protein FAF-like n=1 Tax=Actinidia chinensis var. chinensis TaxID=1590841 RepID=A0A2R6Q7E4_ACTCC|nr:Protein FAF-like [Actinidia chinensis var. chinensis]
MSSTIGKKGLGLSSSPPKVEEEANKAIEKQGIVSILAFESNQTKVSSLRRTLSADMSSKKWLAQQGLISTMKKTASSEELAISSVAEEYSSSSSEGEEEYEGKKELESPGQDDVWRSIQSQKEEIVEKPTQVGVWSSILLSKKADEDDSTKLQPLYVHPLVKRSKSALSEKSLEICTESLGSETGSDGFSSYAPSETGDSEEDKEVQAQQPQLQPESKYSFGKEELRIVKYNYPKKLLPRSFPPPIPSLARYDGSSLHMHSHRENGRLVLEAMSIPSQNYFHAQRKDGRLVLTFANSTPSEEPNPEEMGDQEAEVVDQKKDEVEEMEEMFETFEDEEDDDEEEEEGGEEEIVEKVESELLGGKEIGIVMEQASKLPSGVINVHRSALMMKKLRGVGNRNPTWTNKFNKGVNLVEVEEEGPTPLPQSLPRPPRVARHLPSSPAAASFNTYEYFWRTNPTVPSVINPITQQGSPIKNRLNKVILGNSPKAHDQDQQMVLLRGNKADYLVPLFKGCKEPRRSLLIWEPYCIATS